MSSRSSRKQTRVDSLVSLSVLCVTHVSPVEHNCLVGEWFTAQHEKAGSGTFATVLAGEYLVLTSDPGNVKVILATEFNNFEKGT